MRRKSCLQSDSDDTYQPENAIDDVIAGGVVTGDENALIGIRIDQNSEETTKLMSLFSQWLKI